MRVRSFVLWAALGVSASVTGALLLPASPARGAGGSWTPGDPAATPDPDTQPDKAHFVDGRALLLDGRLGHQTVALDRSGRSAETFVLATITGGGAQTEGTVAPPPVHLVVAVDRSGSMAGSKMSSAVAAAVGAVERMHDGDRVTVVAFDASARVVVPPTRVDSGSRGSIESSIRSMRAGGDTCISCALETATAELEASPGSRDEIRRVLLISDGEATTGVRDATGLRSLAARARDHGLSVSTIGVDLAFDERVMAAIAQESNGRHWFVPDASALSNVFDQEFDSLESAVASDAELTIEPAQGVVVDDVLDRSFQRQGGGRIVVPLGTFDASQEKTVLVRVHVPADSDGTQPVAKLSLAYRDVGQRQDGHCEGRLALDVRSDGTAQSDIDPFVAARIERSRTSRTLTEANALFESGRADEARAALSRRKAELDKTSATAIAAATSIPAAGLGAPRPIAPDFKDQSEAIGQAQAGFAGAAASPAGPPTPSTKSAVRQNQANALDLAF
jgi:Ca-activated chloride channel family protein